MIAFILAVRSARRAFKKADKVKRALIASEALFMLDVTSQAAAYGFEIGKGAPLMQEVTASPDNPFRDLGWPSRVQEGSA